VDVANLYEPAKDGVEDGLFISKSYDASSHFESVCQDVKSIYKRVTGEELKVEGKVKKYDEDGNAIEQE
jgi:Rab GDP dissociation inhibitor